VTEDILAKENEELKEESASAPESNGKPVDEASPAAADEQG